MKFKSTAILVEKGLLKEANMAHATDAAMDPRMRDLTQGIITFFAGALAQKGVEAGMDAVHRKSLQNDVRNNITNFGKALPAYFQGEDLPKAQARLYEIARVAPHVVMNKELTLQMIKGKLHTGLTLEDKQRLVMIESQYNSNPNVSKFMPKLASADLGSVLADAHLVKEAALGRDFKTFGALSLLPVATGLIGGAINHGLAKMKARKMSEELNNSFTQAMSQSNPDTEPLLENKDKARKAFNTLASFAPQVAMDPQAARAFMNKIVSYDQGIDMSTVKELSEITRNLSSNSMSPFATGFTVGNNLVGGSKIMATAAEGLSTSISGNIAPMSEADIRSKAHTDVYNSAVTDRAYADARAAL